MNFDNTNLEDALEAGIVALAMVHAGIITINCNDCSDQQKEMFACDRESDEVVFEEEGYEYYNCPMKFITPAVYNFWDEYSYYKLFPGTAPKYGEHNIRFFHYAKIYENVLNKCMYKEKPKKDETEKIRRNFRK